MVRPVSEIINVKIVDTFFKVTGHWAQGYEARGNIVLSHHLKSGAIKTTHVIQIGQFIFQPSS